MASPYRLPGWLLAATFLAAVLAPVVVWAISTGDPLVYLRYEMPPGQSPYVLSKLIGLLALSIFWLQWMIGFLRRVDWIALPVRRAHATHRHLGLLVFGLVLVHVGLFVYAVSLRTEHFAWHVLVPSFSEGYYKQRIALGILALGLFPLAIVAGILRRRGRLWQWVHRLWIVVFALIFVHAISIGTETRMGVLWYFYLFLAVTMTASLSLWAWRSVAGAHEFFQTCLRGIHRDQLREYTRWPFS